METIEDKIKQLVVDWLGVNDDQVKPDADIINDLGADDLDFVELIMAIEEEFAIAITEDEAEKVNTPADAAELVKSKLGQKWPFEKQ